MGYDRPLRRILAALLAAVCLVWSLPVRPVYAFELENDAQQQEREDGGEETARDDDLDDDPEDDGGDEAVPGEDAGEQEDPDDDPEEDGREPEDDEEEDGGENTDADPGDGEELPAEDEKEAESGPDGYSAGALRALLEELAAELELEADHLIDWLLEDEMFTRKARELVWEGLREDPERAESFFAATEELYEELGPSRTTNADRERASADGLDDILAAGERLRSALDREPEPAVTQTADGLRSGATTPIEDDANLRALTRGAEDRLDEQGEALFRHYAMELGFTTGSGYAGGEADIVLLIDNSLSTQYALSSMLAAAESFVTRPEVFRSGSRIAVVCFSDEGRTLVELSDAAGPDGGPNPELVEAIRSIAADGQSNLQAGLIEARRALGLADDDAPDDGRTRAVLLLSDGMANLRSTDIWALTPFFVGQNTYWRYEIEVDWDGETAAGAKRWSWRYTTDSVYSRGSIFVDDEQKMVGIERASGQDFAQSVARLEAQYLVSQGVDLYAVDYGSRLSSDPAYLDSLTLRMEGEVEFEADVEDPAYEVPVSARRHFSGSRVYDPAEEGFVDALAAEILGGGTAGSALPAFTLRDELGEAFEADPEIVWTLQTPAGDELAAPAGWTLTVSADGGVLTWTAPAGLAPGEYTLCYGVRVRDDEAEPLRYLPDGADAISPSEGASIAYESTSYPFEAVEVAVLPLLDIAASGPEVAFVGDLVRLEGEILRGNGTYHYAWYEPGGEIPIQSGEVPLDGVDVAEGLGLQIPVPALELNAGSGPVVRELEVTDARAWEAGYSGGRLRETVEVAVVGGTLTVRVLGEDGASYRGRFEATIQYTDNDGAVERYHYMGPGTAEYDAASGLRQGSYEVSLYTPYGYRAAQGPQTVTIEPVRDAQGNWIDCEQTVTVRIERTWASFFYSWADRVEALAGRLAEQPGGEAA